MNHRVTKHAAAFSVLLDTRREAAELMAECPSCGALTMLPIEIAWQQGIVYCGECGTKMHVTSATLDALAQQTDGAGATIRRLLSDHR